MSPDTGRIDGGAAPVTEAETVKTLTFQVCDELYEAFEEMATKEGRSVEAVALEWLAKHATPSRPRLTARQRRAALKELRQFAGSFSSGDPHSADNERIDADLVREYANTHEEEP